MAALANAIKVEVVVEDDGKENLTYTMIFLDLNFKFLCIQLFCFVSRIY